MIKHRTIAALGVSQLVCWGISFYLIGVFGEPMAADLGWSRVLVHGGFSAALLAMGLVSPFVGRAIDRVGGGPVMALGSVLCAIACLLLALAHSVEVFYGAWICLGIAMRCILYDAAFAALARMAGPHARRPISYVTLAGGLAATCFWPIGHVLADAYGWRGALDIYAAIAAATAVLHLTLPRRRYRDGEAARGPDLPDAARPVAGNRTVLALLYVAIIALGNGLHAGMSAHLIGILTEVGLGAALAVSVASLRGIGQSGARLIDVAFASRLHPVALNLIAATAMPICFVLALAGAGQPFAAAVFTLAYGGATGILTITRGTLPLVLFDHRTYGAYVGKLLVPSFLVSAASPLAFAAIIDAFGARAALGFTVGVGVMILAASLALTAMHRKGGAK